MGRQSKQALVCGGLLLLLPGCWILNEDYKGPPDLSMAGPDMTECPKYAPGGGGGKDRPQVLVPGGNYQIWDTMFAVKAFWLDVFEVTVGAYRDCRMAGGCTKDPDTGLYCNWTPAAKDKEEHPINCATFAQAKEFCAWAGRRLPTEEEWEYAAAGEQRSTYAWGNEAPKRRDVDMGVEDERLCWDRGVAGLGTCKVGERPKTLLGGTTCFGAADMAGNLWEWTNSEHKPTYTYPSSPCSTACTLRGGAWGSDNPAALRVVYRLRYDASNPAYDGGFRCARGA